MYLKKYELRVIPGACRAIPGVVPDAEAGVRNARTEERVAYEIHMLARTSNKKS